MILKVKDRNFLDSLFLMFVMVPIISNVFALLAQTIFDGSKFTSAKLSNEIKEKEKTQIIELLNRDKTLTTRLNKTQEVSLKNKENK